MPEADRIILGQRELSSTSSFLSTPLYFPPLPPLKRGVLLRHVAARRQRLVASSH